MSMQGARKRRSLLLFLEVSIAVLSLSAFVYLRHITTPQFEVTYRYDQKKSAQGKLPLSVISNGDHLVVNVTMNLSSFYPTIFMASADDCLTGLKINNQTVDITRINLCDYDLQVPVDLGPFLHAGKNELIFYIDDSGGAGGLSLTPSLIDPGNLVTQATLALFVAAVMFMIVRRIPGLRGSPLPWIFYAGTLLRWWYVLGTPAYIREYDAEGHFEYIRYMLDNWKVPPTEAGWEFYHPPLYYVLSAFWIRIVSFLHLSTGDLEHDVQGFSLLLSLLTFAAALWIGSMVFGNKKKKLPLILYSGLIASFPGLVYLAPRINNDTLVQFLSFFFVAMLLHWWEHRRTDAAWNWILLSMIISLGILTKSNALLLAGIGWSLLLIHRAPWKSKLAILTLSLLTILLFTGWFFALRFYHEKNTSIVENTGSLTDELKLTSKPLQLLAFPPIFTVLHPFNDPWEDESGRQYLLPTLFRSAFFGEFSYPYTFNIMATVMVALGLMSGVFMSVGLLRDLLQHSPSRIPMIACLLFLFFGMMAFRVLSPFSSSEDFRYIVVIVVPAAVFAVDGAGLLPAFARPFANAILGSLIILNAIFLLGICVMT